MRKKLKLSSDGGNVGSKKCKRGYGGVWRSLRSADVWNLESGGRFFVGAIGRNLASVAVKMFSHLIYLRKTFYKRTFNAICKDNAAINCITVQHTRDPFPSILTGYTTLVIKNKKNNIHHMCSYYKSHSSNCYPCKNET
jgi:tRNA G26 N,N-dimethylase Trm1